MIDDKRFEFYRETKFKDTEIGKVPEEWEVVRLGDSKISKLIMGQSPPSSSYNTEGKGFPFFQGNAEFGDKYPQKPSQYTTKPLKIAKAEDVLISVRAPVGEVNIATSEICIGRGLAAIRPNENSLNNEYLFYWLLQNKKEIQTKGSGSTFKAITKKDLENLQIPRPPLPEQRAIAQVLADTDEAIETVRESIERLERIKKGLMQILLTRGIGHEKFKDTKIGRIPTEWEVVHFEGIVDLKRKFKVGKVKTTEYKNQGNIPIIDQGDSYIAGYTNREDLKYEGPLPVVIFGDHTTIVKYVDFPFVVGADGVKILIPHHSVDPKYLYYLLLRYKPEPEGYRRHFSRLKEDERVFPRPPLPEQKKITEILGTVDKAIEAKREKKEKLERMKKKIMELLLTGQVRVKIKE